MIQQLTEHAILQDSSSAPLLLSDVSGFQVSYCALYICPQNFILGFLQSKPSNSVRSFLQLPANMCCFHESHLLYYMCNLLFNGSMQFKIWFFFFFWLGLARSLILDLTWLFFPLACPGSFKGYFVYSSLELKDLIICAAGISIVSFHACQMISLLPVLLSQERPCLAAQLSPPVISSSVILQDPLATASYETDLHQVFCFF